MKNLSQRDPKWSYKKLGTCNTTIGKEGCYITCIGMLAGYLPDFVNLQMVEKGGYVRGCLVSASKAASIFKLQYSSVRTKPAFYPTIAEVDFNPKTKTIEQHFVVLLDEHTTIDPWTGYRSQYVYKIKSYRNMRLKQRKDDDVNFTKEQKDFVDHLARKIAYPFPAKNYKWKGFLFTKTDIGLLGGEGKFKQALDSLIIDTKKTGKSPYERIAKYKESNETMAKAMEVLITDNGLLKDEIKKLNKSNDKPKKVKHWFSGFLKWLQKIRKSRKK